MRTYYCVEMGVASYPVNEIRVSTTPPADPLTRQLCLRVRASSAREAEELARGQLSEERYAALVADEAAAHVAANSSANLNRKP